MAQPALRVELHATMSTEEEDEMAGARALAASWSGAVATAVGRPGVQVTAEATDVVHISGLSSHDEVVAAATEVARHGDVQWVTSVPEVFPANAVAS